MTTELDPLPYAVIEPPRYIEDHEVYTLSAHRVAFGQPFTVFFPRYDYDQEESHYPTDAPSWLVTQLASKGTSND